MVLDTSALIAVLFREPESEIFLAAMKSADSLRVSTATLVELTIVASNKDREQGDEALTNLLNALDVVLEPVTLEQASIARGAFLNFGKGRHRAKLNLGDTFAYALAMHLDEPLLYKGFDFAQTDVRSALAA